MKIALIIVLSVFTLITAVAQPQFVWQENGIPVRQADNLSWEKNGALLNGNIYIPWTDTHTGQCCTYLQKFDLSGNQLWQTGGLKLSADFAQYDFLPRITTTADSNIVICWLEYLPQYLSDPLFRLMAQKVSPGGQLLWGQNPVVVDTMDNEASTNDGIDEMQMISDGAGGVYIAWSKNYSNLRRDIYAQHLLANGTWASSNGITVSINEGVQTLAEGNSLVLSDNNSLIIVWRRPVFNTDGNSQLLAQKYGFDNAPLWPTPIVVANFYHPFGPNKSITTDGLGGALVVWEHWTSNGPDIFANHLYGDGILEYITGSYPVCTLPLHQIGAQIISDNQNGAYLLFYETEGLMVYESKLKLQRIDNDCVPVWNNERIVCDLPDVIQVDADFTLLNNGDVGIVWRDSRNETLSYADLFAQKVDGDGLALWTEDGISVCVAPKGQRFPAIFTCGSDQIYVWLDHRLQYDLYLQIKNSSGENYLPENGVKILESFCGGASNPVLSALRNGFLFAWEDSRYFDGHKIMYQIIDQLGYAALTQNGILLNDDSLYSSDPAICQTSDNNVAMVYTEYWGNQTTPTVWAIEAQKIGIDGTKLWSEDGITITPPAINYFDPPKICSDSWNGITFVAYSYETVYNVWESRKVFLDAISADGQPWDEPRQIFSSDNCQIVNNLFYLNSCWKIYVVWTENIGNDYILHVTKTDGEAMEWDRVLGQTTAIGANISAALDPDDKLIIAWCAYNQTNHKALYAQKISGAGDLLWGDAHLEIADGNYDAQKPRVVVNNDGSSFVVFHRVLGGEGDIKIQKISATGQILFAPTGNFVVFDQHDQDNPVAVSNDENGVIIAWEDARNDSNYDIYSICLDASGNYDNQCWTENGNAVRNYWGDAISPCIISDGWHGAVVAWLDERSGGPNQTGGSQDVFIQNINDNIIWSVPPDISQPQHCQLNPVYPNPFNSSATISYYLPLAGQMSLKIYDLLGREVIKLTDDRQTAGWHLITFDGSAISSGIYFCVMETPEGQKFVRKMVLIK